MTDSEVVQGSSGGAGSGFSDMPTTRAGKWAARLAVVFVGMFAINSFVFMPFSGSAAPWRQVVLPYYGITMLLVGLAAGAVAAIALLKSKERSWVVWLALVPGLMMLTFILGEVLIPH